MVLEVKGVGVVFQPQNRVFRLVVQGATTTPVEVLHDISFTVGAGQIVSIIGPNGAGKSTLLRTVLGLVPATSGEVGLFGRDIGSRALDLQSRVGVSFSEDRSFHWRLTGRQNLEFYAMLAGMTAQEATRRTTDLLEQLDLAHRDKAVFGYSSGMMARLGLARALLAWPDLLVLDEPTRALDPVAGARFIEDLAGLAADGVAVLMASHRIDEVAACSDVIHALVGGRFAWSGTPQELPGEKAPLNRWLARLGDGRE